MGKVLAESERMHRLELSDGTPVGWVYSGAIGLHAFSDEQCAIAAVRVVWRALDADLRQQCDAWPHYEPAFDRLRVVGCDGGEWISDTDRLLARLLRLEEAPRPCVSMVVDGRLAVTRPRDVPRRGCLAIEFEVPSDVPLGTLVAASCPMSRALQDTERPATNERPAGRPAHEPLVSEKHRR